MRIFAYLLSYLLLKQVRARVCVCGSDDSDWWEAESVASGEIGMIPRNYVTFDNDEKESQMYAPQPAHTSRTHHAPTTVTPVRYQKYTTNRRVLYKVGSRRPKANGSGVYMVMQKIKAIGH